MAIVSCVWRQLHVFLIGSLSVSFVIGQSFPRLGSATDIFDWFTVRVLYHWIGFPALDIRYTCIFDWFTVCVLYHWP